MQLDPYAFIYGLVLFGVVWRFRSFVSGLITLIVFVLFYPAISVIAQKVFNGVHLLPF
jgi:hypothetical protein